MVPKTVLVVEDDLAIQHLLNWVLRHAGFEVMLATDGREALQRFHADQPDAVILDLNLPHEPGEQVFDAIKAVRDVPILVMTGTALFVTDLIRRVPGAQGYFLKPLDLAGMVATVRTILQIPIPPPRTMS